ncbi:MAG: type II secretion system F family protein [Kangiellaceae bacterium]|nr:type II secretion system F family protein [Kangiellaceae bacterium]
MRRKQHKIDKARQQSPFVLRDLATLIEAGVTPVDAVKKLLPRHQQWQVVLTQLESGRAVSLALKKADVISQYEAELIKASEQAGRLSEGLRSISHSVEQRMLRRSKARSKFFLPIATLVIAIIVTAILSAVGNPEASLGSIIFIALAQLAVVYWVSKQLLNLLLSDACAVLKTMRFRANDNWYKQLLEQTVFTALLWQVNSGIDFKSAFINISRLINEPNIRKQLSSTARMCEQGLSLTQSVNQSNLNVTDALKQILITAEASGNWQMAIQRHLELLNDTLELRLETLTDWLPRVYYAFVVLIALRVIF